MKLYALIQHSKSLYQIKQLNTGNIQKPHSLKVYCIMFSRFTSLEYILLIRRIVLFNEAQNNDDAPSARLPLPDC